MISLRRLLRLSALFCGIVLLSACTAPVTSASTPTLLPAGIKPPTPSTSPAAASFSSSIPPIIETGPAQSGTSLPALEIPYTRDAPLTDTQEILNTLDALRQQQENWFSRPGWYQKTVCNYGTLGIDDWMDCLYFLVHVVGEARTCREQMVYFVINNQAMPFEIMLEDGSVAGFNLPEGSFRVDGIRSPDAVVQCSLENFESVEVWGEALLTNERAWFEDFMNDLNTGGGRPEEGSSAIAGSVSAWQELSGDQSIFVLFYEITAYREPRPLFLDPSMGQSMVVERSTRIKTFDLVTGLPLSEQEVLFLQNGQVAGGDDSGGSIQYAFFEHLPAELAQVYADTAARVLAELGK